AAQFGPAACPDQGLEVVMHVELQLLQAFDVFRLFGLKRIEHRLRLASGMNAPLDAELPDRLNKSKAPGDDADRADDGPAMGENFIGRNGDPIPPRGRDILAEGDNRDILLRGQSADAGMDQGRLDRRSSWRIDEERHGRNSLAGESTLQRLGQALHRQGWP